MPSSVMMKESVLNLLRITGAFAPFRWAHRGQALIITYHRFSEREGGARISARAFAEQAQYLAAHYTLVPLSQLADCLRRREIPPGLAAITIDDGYRDAYEIAFPILRRHCAPATVFVVTEFVNGTTWLWTDKPRYLTASLAAPQAFEIGIGDHKLRLELNGGASRAVAAGLINAALKPLSRRSQGRLNRATGLEAKGEAA